jgi:transposase
MSKSGAARLFDVSLSPVKRYSKLSQKKASLKSRKGGGRPPKINESAKKVLEEDVKERLAATIAARRPLLEHTMGTTLFDANVRRLLKRMGLSRKKKVGGDGTGRVLESSLEGYGCRRARRLLGNFGRRA